MIHVQIASQITSTGLEGVRWVLLDSSLADGGAGPVAAARLSGPAHDDPAASPAALPPAAPAGRPTGLIKLLVVSLALGAALWLAQARLGPPAQRTGPPVVAPVPAPASPTLAAPPLRKALAAPGAPLLSLALP